MNTKQFFIWAYTTLLIFNFAPAITYASDFNVTPSYLTRDLCVNVGNTDYVITVFVGIEEGNDQFFISCVENNTIAYDWLNGANIDIYPILPVSYRFFEVPFGSECDNAIGTTPENYLTCQNDITLVNSGILTISQYGVGGLFHFTNPDTNAPSDSPTDLLASVGIVSTDTFASALPYMLLFIGVPLAFYILQSLKKVVPKDEKKTFDIVPVKSGGVYHTTFKERKKDL